MIETLKELFLNESLDAHAFKCKTDIGYTFDKVVLRIPHDEGNNFENYLVSKEEMDVQSSDDCFEPVLVNFTCKFEFVYSVPYTCFELKYTNVHLMKFPYSFKHSLTKYSK